MGEHKSFRVERTDLLFFLMRRDKKSSRRASLREPKVSHVLLLVSVLRAEAQFTAGWLVYLHPVIVAPVIVTAAFARSRPIKLPPVKVVAAPARIVPCKLEVVIVAASAIHQ